MPIFTQFYWGLSLTTVGVASLHALAMTWLVMSNRIDVAFAVFIGLISLSLSLFGTLILWNIKGFKKKYMTEEILANFTRSLISPEVLHDPLVKNLIVGRIVDDMLYRPNVWQQAIPGMSSVNRQLCSDMCSRRIRELRREAGLEAQNSEVPESEANLTRLGAEITKLTALRTSLSN